MRKRMICILLLCVLLTGLFPVCARAETAYALPVQIDGREAGAVRAMDGSYLGNIYLSLTDLSAVLVGTEKQYRFERVISTTDGEYFNIQRGQAATLPSGADEIGTVPVSSSLNPKRNRLLVDGQERRYYTHNPGNGDLYMSLTDVQLMLDMTVFFSGGRLILSPGKPFQPDLAELDREGYFEMMNAVFLGDAESGEILFYRNSRFPVPVASLSKLVSYLVLEEAIDTGEISTGDWVRISENAQALSRSGDGMVHLTAGTAVPFSELLSAMLVASSNECALALAEHLCGSEAAFVERMRTRARELGLTTAELWNCNGLPSFTEGSVPVKHQNRMSAADLFRLTQTVLSKYPGITEISGVQYAHMPSLNDYWTANSNPLVFNMEGITGLKTGSTNRAGYCLVATMPVETGGEQHNIVLVLLGAETADIRGQAAEILLRYAGRLYAS